MNGVKWEWVKVMNGVNCRLESTPLLTSCMMEGVNEKVPVCGTGCWKWVDGKSELKHLYSRKRIARIRGEISTFPQLLKVNAAPDPRRRRRNCKFELDRR